MIRRQDRIIGGMPENPFMPLKTTGLTGHADRTGVGRRNEEPDGSKGSEG